MDLVYREYRCRPGGVYRVLDALHEQIPPGLSKWLDIPGLGPKKIYKVHRELGITEMAELVDKCRDGSVAELKGMGTKTADKILSSIAFMEKFGERCRADQAATVAKTFIDFLCGQPGVDAISLAGSSRRRQGPQDRPLRQDGRQG